MKHLFIINPVAGKGKAMDYLEKIHKIFEERQDEYIIELTKNQGHATEIVKKYTEADDYRVYSIGGDGTLNEVLNGMAFTNSSLAVIPAGTGNDFIKNIYDEESYENILEDTINGNEEFFDLAKLNNRFYINISSAGLDAEVVYNAIKLKKLKFIKSSMAYLLSIFITVFRFKSIDMVIEVDGNILNRKILLIAVANGKYYGGGMLVAPEAIINDGIFDICLVNHLNIFRILTLFPKLIKGTHKDIKEVEFIKGKNIIINSKDLFSVNIDGEIMRSNKVHFEIVPKGIKVVKPLYNN
ncbi:diacylglycerol/lipid kinase family protein [Desnuesiella massiliensis]|uniref:diacylglycerol/lipid kinase family protein n=1 Tax=Desnuesiella massiliensis TaxID=1650662 RepID=UPI0006E14000|nr:diacylglycerol kinase family protein [Desnuesiella massiliensis]